MGFGRTNPNPQTLAFKEPMYGLVRPNHMMGVVGCTTSKENYPTPNPWEVNVTIINFNAVGYMILLILWPT